MKLFLLQSTLFLFQLYLWIFSHTFVGLLTVPLSFAFVLFSLYCWFKSDHP